MRLNIFVCLFIIIGLLSADVHANSIYENSIDGKINALLKENNEVEQMFNNPMAEMNTNSKKPMKREEADHLVAIPQKVIVASDRDFKNQTTTIVKKNRSKSMIHVIDLDSSSSGVEHFEGIKTCIGFAK